MTDLAKQFLDEWTLTRPQVPISRQEAEAIAEEWEADAAENGIDPDDLGAAAGDSLVDYLLRTYGDGTIEL